MFSWSTLKIFYLLINFIQNIQMIDATRCYLCQTAPERIICSLQMECQGKACYVMMDGKNNVAGCTSEVDTVKRSVGCYNETSTRKVCACYTNFCNTIIIAATSESLSFSPLTSSITPPWETGYSIPTTSTLQTSSSPVISTSVSSFTTLSPTTTPQISTILFTTSLPRTTTITPYSPSTATTILSTTQTPPKNQSINYNTHFIPSLLFMILITIIITN